MSVLHTEDEGSIPFVGTVIYVIFIFIIFNRIDVIYTYLFLFALSLLVKIYLISCGVIGSIFGC